MLDRDREQGGQLEQLRVCLLGGAALTHRLAQKALDTRAMRKSQIQGWIAAGLVGADRDEVFLLAQHGERRAQLLAGVGDSGRDDLRRLL